MGQKDQAELVDPPVTKRKKRKDRPSLAERARKQGRELAELGNTAVNTPRQLPSHVGGLLRRSLRTMYKARGGGFYASGFVVCFVILELGTLFGEIQSSTGLGSFFSEQLLQLLFRFTIDSMANTIQSLLWPILLISWSPIYGGLSLALGYLVFDRYIKKPLEGLLFGATPAAAPQEPQS